ncbi:cofactor-independent phosphoglycerate mutase [Candidatus Poribacteria bacterium]|nr:cofactor-independent phosphoglycerate mutase [Candidatus Poribacteria bacterium]
MKYIILVGDGMADYPIDELDGKTPLEVADTTYIDQIAGRGISGLVNTIPEDMPPGSDVANLAVLGYDPVIYYEGRGPLEAGSMGVKLDDDEVAYRCNIVCVDDKIMLDYSSGHISSEEARELIELVDKHLGTEEIMFHAGVSYRHLMVHKHGSINLDCTPPHDITDKPYADYLPKGEGQEIIRDLMQNSKAILDDHPVNKKRRAKGKNPGNMIWLWGQGKAPQMPTLMEKYGFTGSVISAVDLIKGIGYYAGLDIIEVPGATGYLDTNYLGKAQYALDSLKEKDFVWVHVEAPDEASHAGNIAAKIKAIEDFDSKVAGTILKGMEERGEDYILLVMPDHLTPIIERTHVHGSIPFTVCGTEVKSDGINSFSEAAAKSSSLNFDKGHELMSYLVRMSKE